MLDHKKQCHVLVIEPVATVRQMIADTLKDLGYVHVQAIPKAKDALHYMEVEPVDG
jgi:CheY-like chemotaxis protein